MMVAIFSDFESAKAAADESEGLVVSACTNRDEDGFVYFLTPVDVSDKKMWEISYQARFGEPMDPYESQYLSFLAGQAKASK